VIQTFDFEIFYRAGRLHTAADGLSRRPCQKDCKHCQRRERDGLLDENEDDVLDVVHAYRSFPVKEFLVNATEIVHETPWDDDAIRTAQLDDPDIAPVYKAKMAGIRPSPQQHSDASSATKQLLKQWEVLTWQGRGVLCRVWYSHNNQLRNQIILPRSLRPAVIMAAHHPVPRAHYRRNKMMERIRMRYYWPEYLQDVELYLQQCHRCLDRGNPQRRRAPLQCYNSGAPFERVSVDLLGPFPRTPRGNVYLVTAYDTFTRWPEAIPVPDISARTVASALLYHVFTRFGIPRELHSDRGPTFEAKLFNEIMALLQIRRTRTTPLHPSGNPVERMNRTLKEHLTLLVDDHQSGICKPPSFCGPIDA